MKNYVGREIPDYLLQNGKVETTVTRAKEVRPLAEKMITLGKKNTLASRRAAGARPWHARVRGGIDEVRMHGILAGLAMTAALLIAPRILAVIVSCSM